MRNCPDITTLNSLSLAIIQKCAIRHKQCKATWQSAIGGAHYCNRIKTIAMRQRAIGAHPAAFSVAISSLEEIARIALAMSLLFVKLHTPPASAPIWAHWEVRWQFLADLQKVKSITPLLLNLTIYMKLNKNYEMLSFHWRKYIKHLLQWMKF